MPTTSHKKTILFVCTGNTCRSLLAERLMEKYLSKERIKGVEVVSCGISASPSFVVPEEVKGILKREGINISHTPLQVKAELLENATIVLTMDEHHKKYLSTFYPSFSKKVYLFKEYINKSGEIHDPIGKSREEFEKIFYEIKSCVLELIKKIKNEWKLS